MFLERDIPIYIKNFPLKISLAFVDFASNLSYRLS